MAATDDAQITQILGLEKSRVAVLTIGATNVQVSGACRRKSIFLRNTSAGGQVISVARSNTDNAVAGSGVVLNVNDTFTDSTSADYKCWSGRIMAIASGAGALLAVEEVYE